jgi:DNA-binding transcriptional regulator GbsR (MarR family)
LGELFSSTSKGFGETRPIVNRVKILEYLATCEKPVRRQDISECLGINPTSVANHMRDLSKLSLAEYDSVDMESKGWSRYSLREDADISQITNYVDQRNMTRLVAELVWELKEVDSKIISDFIRDNKIADNWNDHSLMVVISGILGHFEKSGILRRVKFRGGEEMSQATITEGGSKLVREVIIPIKSALSGDTERLKYFGNIDWRLCAPAVVAKFRDRSRHANKRSKEERAAEIYDYVLRNPGVRYRDIKKHFQRSVERTLHWMEVSGVFRAERGVKAVRFFAIPATNPSETPGPIV